MAPVAERVPCAVDATGVAERFHEQLRAMFGADPLILAGANETCEVVTATTGACCQRLAPELFKRLRRRDLANVVVVVDTDTVMLEPRVMEHHLAASRVVSIPVVAFDASPATTADSLAVLAHSDVAEAASLNLRWLRLLSDIREGALQFTDGRTTLTCQLSATVAVMRSSWRSPGSRASSRDRTGQIPATRRSMSCASTC